MADYTWPSIYWLYSVMALFVAGAAFFLLRAIRTGAVADDETPKFRMLEDEGGYDGDGKARHPGA